MQTRQYLGPVLSALTFLLCSFNPVSSTSSLKPSVFPYFWETRSPGSLEEACKAFLEILTFALPAQVRCGSCCASWRCLPPILSSLWSLHKHCYLNHLPDLFYFWNGWMSYRSWHLAASSILVYCIAEYVAQTTKTWKESLPNVCKWEYKNSEYMCLAQTHTATFQEKLGLGHRSPTFKLEMACTNVTVAD